MDVAGAQLTIIIKYRVEPESLPAFLELLRRNSRDTLADDGCFRMNRRSMEALPEPLSSQNLWRAQVDIEKHRAKPGHNA